MPDKQSRDLWTRRSKPEAYLRRQSNLSISAPQHSHTVHHRSPLANLYFLLEEMRVWWGFFFFPSSTATTQCMIWEQRRCCRGHSYRCFMRTPTSGNSCGLGWSATGDMIFCARVQPTVSRIHPPLTDGGRGGRRAERQRSAAHSKLVYLANIRRWNWLFSSVLDENTLNKTPENNASRWVDFFRGTFQQELSEPTPWPLTLCFQPTAKNALKDCEKQTFTGSEGGKNKEVGANYWRQGQKPQPPFATSKRRFIPITERYGTHFW